MLCIAWTNKRASTMEYGVVVAISYWVCGSNNIRAHYWADSQCTPWTWRMGLFKSTSEFHGADFSSLYAFVGTVVLCSNRTGRPHTIPIFQ